MTNLLEEDDGLPDPVPLKDFLSQQFEPCVVDDCDDEEEDDDQDESEYEWRKQTREVMERWKQKDEPKDKRVAGILERQANILNIASEEDLKKVEAKLKLAEEKVKATPAAPVEPKAEPRPDPAEPAKTDDFSNYPLVSILEISNWEIDKSKYLLGDGWLERGDGGILFSGAGIGKSVVTNQVGILWSVGKPAFETLPNGPLKVLIVQAEDGHNDQIRMAHMIHHMGFTGEEKTLIGNNCKIVTCNDRTDDSFFKLLEYKMKEFHSDIVIINPFHSYMSGDVKDEVPVKAFLRQKLTPILKTHDAGALIVHHTPKQNYRDTSNWRVTDFMYGMAGAAELTNWPRAVIAIEPTGDPSVFQMIAAKRWKRSGWTNAKQHIAYSDNPEVMMWIPATEAQVKESNRKVAMNPVQLFDLIPECGTISSDEWFAVAKNKYGISDKVFADVRKTLRNPKKPGFTRWVDYSEKHKLWFLTLAGLERRGGLSKTHDLQKFWDEKKDDDRIVF